MNKYGLIFLFLLPVASVFGQKKSKVELVYSTVAEGVGKNIFKVRNGVFKQDFSTLTSDSAIFYRDLNMVDAFGHVVIDQGDTLHVYSDKLNYNGNTKVAILTNHVKMVDKDATLTTNYFTYNTATRIGIYTNNGKLVNKDNTLTSKNGYYFAKTRDEYFRYDVVCTTPDAVIKTDTLRYNSGTRISYFYGPTHIYGKDKDVLYTENGTYNTTTEQAFFGKNNLYTQATKTLKGDSLFYDRLKGYGRAIKNVTFFDTEQKTTIKGELGEYYKQPYEIMVMTQHPYMIIVTEDSIANKSGDKKAAADSLFKNRKRAGADTVTKKTIALVKPGDQKLTLQGITDSVTKKLPNTGANKPAKQPALTSTGKTNPGTKKSAPRQNVPSGQTNGKTPAQNQTMETGLKDIKDTAKTVKNVREDSLFFGADTLQTRVLTFKDLKTLQKEQYQASHRDTSIKIVKKAAPIVYTKPPKFLTIDPPQRWPKDTIFLHPDLFGKPDAPAARKTTPKIVKVVPKKTAADSVKDKRKADSLALHAPKVLSDTSRVRIVYGYHNARIFKSDLQAKADSMFFSGSDSTIRLYVNPIMWTQGSQLSGDTINLQMKNKKLDNLDMFPSAFIVNIEKNDSTHFNQAGGKLMHATFKNNKLNTFLITGNAETIYFKRDTVKNVVTDMSRTVSGKFGSAFKNGKITTMTFTEKYVDNWTPIAKTKQEDRTLKSFIWKPKERPLSKESILFAYNKNPAPVKPPAGKTVPGFKKPGKPAPGKPAGSKPARDTSAQPAAIKTKKDSTVKDTSALKKPLAKKP